ncbi:MAG TPA: TetR/AcrR family transcriptional regulator [Kofleriaceae bacterium]|jgi:AcrR family transcriptional regulator|nr:TetR/AcrR family transcriptional regulator [Kofleriaceae bacterium]
MARAPDLARRAELAARAFDVIRTRGVTNTTMSDLAAELGLKRPTLYFYFKDLGAVFEAVLEETQRTYFAHVTSKVAGVVHPIDLLAQVMRATLEFHQGRRDRIVLLFQLWAVGGSDPEQVIAKNRELVEPMRALLVKTIEQGVAGGWIAPCDPARLVDLALTVLDGSLVHEVIRSQSSLPLVDEFEKRVLAPLRRSRPRRKKKKS